MKKNVIILISVILVLLALTVSFVSGVFVAGMLSGGSPAPQNTRKQAVGGPADLGPVREVYGELAHGYVEKVNREKLIDGAIEGMLKSLKDPYTRRLKRTDFGDFQEQTTGHFGGVGIELGMRENKLTVVSPIKDTPADRAGVQSGDFIVKIDDKSTEGMALEEAVKSIRGAEGTKVKLTFARNGGASFTKELTREQIKMPNVSGRILDKDIGYIKVHAFNSDTTKDVRKELDGFKDKGVKGVIVDLRNNPGGLLNEAVSISSLFIKSGPIVKVKSRTGKTTSLTANPGADDKIPLVVLVNGGSASASEIFSGAVQDTGRGAIVGEKTFGKASVQTVIPLSDNSGLVMTTAKYLTPRNRDIHKRGITPDVVIKLPKKDWHKMSGPNDPQLNKAKDVLRDIMAGKSFKKAS